MPPYAHISIDLSLRAGYPPINILGFPGIHGPTVTGIQGMGVSIPRAAAVADATEGLAIQLHIPNGRTFKRDILSIIFANGILETTPFTGNTVKSDGTVPNEH